MLRVIMYTVNHAISVGFSPSETNYFEGAVKGGHRPSRSATTIRSRNTALIRENARLVAHRFSAARRSLFITMAFKFFSSDPRQPPPPPPLVLCSLEAYKRTRWVDGFVGVVLYNDEDGSRLVRVYNIICTHTHEIISHDLYDKKRKRYDIYLYV